MSQHFFALKRGPSVTVQSKLLEKWIAMLQWGLNFTQKNVHILWTLMDILYGFNLFLVHNAGIQYANKP